MIGRPKGSGVRPWQERFWEKIIPEPNSGCWIWIGAWNPKGYGNFGVSKSEHVNAHVLAYRTLRGEIPEGCELDHLCRVRCCVNPWHMEPVSHAVNLERSPVVRALNMVKVGLMLEARKPRHMEAACEASM